jgi:dolichyl-phosphate beta-glucosyltransferase
MNKLISVIIPAYNEEDRISSTLDKIINYLDSKNYNYEIIVVDDGSSDKTDLVVRNFGLKVRYIKQFKNMGKGAAVRRGMLEAKGEIRLFSDADLSTPIYEIEKLLSEINNGFDIVIGNRAMNPDNIKEHQPFYRELMGKTFNRIVQLLLIKGITDTQCGFKAYSSKAAIEIFEKSKINGFSFDVESLYLASKSGYKISQVSVEWYNDIRTKVDPIKDSIKMLIEILKIRNLHKI